MSIKTVNKYGFFNTTSADVTGVKDTIQGVPPKGTDDGLMPGNGFNDSWILRYVDEEFYLEQLKPNLGTYKIIAPEWIDIKPLAYKMSWFRNVPILDYSLSIENDAVYRTNQNFGEDVIYLTEIRGRIKTFEYEASYIRLSDAIALNPGLLQWFETDVAWKDWPIESRFWNTPNKYFINGFLLSLGPNNKVTPVNYPVLRNGYPSIDARLAFFWDGRIDQPTEYFSLSYGWQADATAGLTVFPPLLPGKSYNIRQPWDGLGEHGIPEPITPKDTLIIPPIGTETVTETTTGNPIEYLINTVGRPGIDWSYSVLPDLNSVPSDLKVERVENVITSVLPTNLVPFRSTKLKISAQPNITGKEKKFNIVIRSNVQPGTMGYSRFDVKPLDNIIEVIQKPLPLTRVTMASSIGTATIDTTEPLIQENLIPNAFSRLNLEAASRESYKDVFRPYIIGPFPKLNLKPGVTTDVTINVDQVYFGANVSFGNLISVNNVRYYRYVNGVREEIKFIIQDNFSSAQEIVCNVTLLNEIDNDTTIIPVTITNPTNVGDIDLGGLSVTNNTDFILTRTDTDDQFYGSFELNIISNNNQLGFLHLDGLVASDVVGSQSLKIPYSRLKDKSLKVELRDKDSACDWFYRISLERVQGGAQQYAIFVERWDFYDNTYIEIVNQFSITKADLYFEILNKNDKIPQFNILDSPKKVPYGTRNINFSYSAKYSTNIKYDIKAWKNNTWEPILTNEYFKDESDTDIRLNKPNNLIDLRLPDSVRQYERIKFEFRPRQILKYIATGTNVNSPGTNDSEERFGSLTSVEINVDPPTLKADPNNITIEYNQTSFQFSVITETDHEWIIKKSTGADWILLDNLYQTGNKIVRINTTSNPNNTSRSAVLTITSRFFPNVTTTVNITQKESKLNLPVKFYFDLASTQFRGIGPYPNTKEESRVTAPFYVKRVGSNYEVLRTTNVPILLRQRILSGNNTWNRTEPISLFGTVTTATKVEELTYNPVNNLNDLQNNQFVVWSVDVINSNYNLGPFWSSTNTDFLPLPEQVSRFSITGDPEVVTFNIKYKVGGVIGESTAQYFLKPIFVETPKFSLTPQIQTVRALYDDNSTIDNVKNIVVTGLIDNGTVKPGLLSTENRLIFEPNINNITFYSRSRAPFPFDRKTAPKINYLSSFLPNIDTVNIFGVRFNSGIMEDGSIVGVLPIRFRNIIGDEETYELEFDITRETVYTQSQFYIDPIRKAINVNKDGIPTSVSKINDPETFNIKITGRELNIKDPTLCRTKDCFYEYSPFEPGDGRFSILRNGVKLQYEKPGDDVRIREINPNTTYGLNVDLESTRSNTGTFDVDVYRLTGKVFGSAIIRYRSWYQTLPENEKVLESIVYFEIEPILPEEPRTPPPPPPRNPSYVVTSTASPDIVVDVDCNNLILNDDALQPTLVVVRQTNSITNEVTDLSYGLSEELNKNEYRIKSVSSSPPGLNLLSTVSGLVTLETDTLSQSYDVTVEIEYIDNNLNFGNTSAKFKVIRNEPLPYTVTFNPNVQLINVAVDYENVIEAVSHRAITISGIESNRRGSNNLVYTTGPITKGTFKITKIEGFVQSLSIPTQNEILIQQNGILTNNTSIVVYVDYMDSCGIVKTKIPITISVIKIPPPGQDVIANITPKSVDVYVDFRRSFVQDPIPFTEFLINAGERRLNSNVNHAPMIYTENKNLIKNQFRIETVTGESGWSYDLISQNPKFRPKIQKLLASENASALIRYKDLSGKEGTISLPFYLNRIQLPRKYSNISIKTGLDNQIVYVSDKYEVIDQIYEEIRDIPIIAKEILSDGRTENKMNFVKRNQTQEGWKLIDDSTFTITGVYAYEENTNIFVDYIAFDILDSGNIKVLANEIKTNIIVKIYTEYIDNYGNEGSVELISRIIPDVTPPLLTKIEYPEGINARDYIGYDENFDVIFESEYTNNVSIYVQEYGIGTFYGRYLPDDTAKFNMQDLIDRFGISTEPTPGLVDNDAFSFNLILVPERLMSDGSYKEGQREDITIVFNPSDIQIPRPYIINNLNEVIKPKFDFTVYKDEVAKYLNHYLHFDNFEPRLIANWERDDITFSEFELDELGNEITVEENPTLILKMYEPLPEEIQLNTSVWISKQRS